MHDRLTIQRISSQHSLFPGASTCVVLLHLSSDLPYQSSRRSRHFRHLFNCGANGRVAARLTGVEKRLARGIPDWSTEWRHTPRCRLADGEFQTRGQPVYKANISDRSCWGYERSVLKTIYCLFRLWLALGCGKRRFHSTIYSQGERLLF
jgi:hypothetical protein